MAEALAPGVEVRHEDWGGEELLQQTFTRVAFVEVDLTEADLRGLDAMNGTLRGLDLSASDLAGADLSGCDLRGSDLSSVDPRTVQLRGAVITPEQAVVLVGALGPEVRPD